MQVGEQREEPVESWHRIRITITSAFPNRFNRHAEEGSTACRSPLVVGPRDRKRRFTFDLQQSGNPLHSQMSQSIGQYLEP